LRDTLSSLVAAVVEEEVHGIEVAVMLVMLVNSNKQLLLSLQILVELDKLKVVTAAVEAAVAAAPMVEVVADQAKITPVVVEAAQGVIPDMM